MGNMDYLERSILITETELPRTRLVGNPLNRGNALGSPLPTTRCRCKLSYQPLTSSFFSVINWSKSA